MRRTTRSDSAFCSIGATSHSPAAYSPATTSSVGSAAIASSCLSETPAPRITTSSLERLRFASASTVPSAVITGASSSTRCGVVKSTYCSACVKW